MVEKFAAQNMDLVFGTLFSHVVMGSAPRAGELQIPYLVCSEGHHVASGALNRWTLQPGITDVKSQVQCHGPLGGGEPRQAGHDDLPRLRLRLRPPRLLHRRDPGAGRRGRSSSSPSRRPRPPSPATCPASRRRPRSSTTSWSAPPSSPSSRSSASSTAPPATREIFGFIDSLEAVDITTPGLEFLDGSHFWEGHPRYKQADASEFETFYRTAVGVDDNGAATADAKEVSTYAHMFSTWETLFVIKAAMEAAGYQGPDDRQAVVEAIEAMTDFTASNEHPQGDKVFNGKTHQVFGHQSISKVEGGKLNVVHTTSIEDGLYPDEVDYTTMPF